MQNHLRKTAIPALALTTALVLMAPAILSTGAFAIAPETTTKDRGMHFVGQPDLQVTKEGDTAFLTVSGEVAGSGTGGTATLSSTAVIVVGCETQGGGTPPGQEEDEDDTTASEPFTADNGRGSFTVSTEDDPVTIPSDFECPSANMTPFLVSVTFTDIILTVTSNEGKSITATFADQDP
jgi:hypothetical protein